MRPDSTCRSATREATISNGTVRSIGSRFICSLLVVLLLALGSTQPAHAAPQSLTQAQSQAAALEAQLKDLKDQAAALQAAYATAASQLAQTEADAAKNADLLTQAQVDQVNAEDALSARLTQIYKEGRGGTLEALLSATSFTELLDRVSLLERISKRDDDLLRQVKDYRAQVAADADTLTAQLEQQQAAADKAEAAKQAMTQKLAQAKQSLTGKEAEVAQLQKQWQDQLDAQAKLDQQHQAELDAALAAAQAAAQAGNNGADSGGGSSGGGSGTTTSTTSTTHKTTTTTNKPGTTTTTKKPGATTTSTTSSGGATHHAGVTNILKPEQIALVAQQAGFSGDSLVMAVAVAMTESGSNANAIGRLKTYGLWQIYAHAHPTMIDPSNPDASRWYDPYVNATFAYKIAVGGKSWVPWSVYTSGAYLSRMDAARAGVNLLLSNPGSVTPPSVK